VAQVDKHPQLRFCGWSSRATSFLPMHTYTGRYFAYLCLWVNSYRQAWYVWVGVACLGNW